MLPFTKDKKYLICFDSDGTVMDTMTVKHETSFGPCFIDVFGIKDGAEDILNHWLNVNLYEITRGINRFQGLDEIITYSHKYGYHWEGEEEFQKWARTTPKFSEALLEQEISKNSNNHALKLALLWSKEVNIKITSLPPSHSFNGVKEQLIKINKVADLLGVSSANKAAVIEEWDRLNFSPLFKYIACQDVGSKSKIIEEALLLGYSPEDVIMVGDAMGDLKAAQNNKVRFYPIMPSKEVESWGKIYEEAIIPLLEGRFDDSYQESLNKRFIDFLNK